MSNKKDSLGERIKNSYENRTRYYLPRRTYTIVRLDGRAHSSYTQGLPKPFCKKYNNAIDQTAKYLCQNIAGCKLAYCQSDEITLVLTDFDQIDTQAFFDGNIQKITSVVASMAAAYFNQEHIRPQKDKLASFDARVFTIADRTEVYNCLYWRQQDCSRNSLSMLAQANFSHKQLHKKKRDDIHEMLHSIGINWNNESTRFKRGSCVIKKPDEGWVIDYDIPIFSQKKEYILERLPVLN